MNGSSEQLVLELLVGAIRTGPWLGLSEISAQNEGMGHLPGNFYIASDQVVKSKSPKGADF